MCASWSEDVQVMCVLIYILSCVPTSYFKLNGYTFRESNSATMIHASLFLKGRSPGSSVG